MGTDDCGYCCGPEHCEEAIRFAKESYGIELPKTEHPRLPLMGPSGCTAAPHLRPVCAIHQCDINSLGFFKGNRKGTARYFYLYNRILEGELRRENPDDGVVDLLQEGGTE